MADAVPIEVLHGSLEERVLRYLLEAYPVTTAALARDLRISEARLGRVLKALATRGVVELEELPDKTFVRLLRQDFSFFGYKDSQRKRFKQSGGNRKTSKDVEGPMFG
jgi:predicted ArsR family transcriptional regulator